jgi:exopolysaccharide production protein ExoQ
MNPSIALLLWLALLLALLYFDPAREQRSSLALWIPVIWIAILGSRLPSQWLGGNLGRVAEAMEEGSGLDRAVYTFLMLLAFGVLVSRSLAWGRVLVLNAVLVAALCFALLSVLWSEYPFVTFKRWGRDLGVYLMILVTLTDPRPYEAIRTVLRRTCYLLIPLSILLNKYFPHLAKEYDSWTGLGYYMGAATSKNMLGLLCMVSGLFFFWDTLTRWAHRKERRTQRIICVNIAFIAMTLWLLREAGSASSNVCLVLGCLIIAAAHSKFFRRHPTVLMTLIPIGISLYLLLEFVFGIDIIAALAELVGRNPDLTGRTKIWRVVLSTNTNPIVGTGYESFWLGPRLLWIWQQVGPINEAHNGYLEVYLNLGLIGLLLLVAFLITSYLTIVRVTKASPTNGSLSLALWTILLFYNVTESSFQPQLLWSVFLLGALVVPRRSLRTATHATRPIGSQHTELTNGHPLPAGKVKDDARFGIRNINTG